MIAAALASSPPPLPGFLNALSGTLEHYGLWAVGLLITLEDFGVPVPGETILIAGAIFAGAGRVTIGYFAGNNITTVYHYITLYSYYVLAALVVLLVGYIVWRRRRRRRTATATATATAAAAASQTDESPEGRSASEAAEPSPDQHGPVHAVPEEQKTTEIAPSEHVAGPSVPDRHAPEQPSRRQ